MDPEATPGGEETGGADERTEISRRIVGVVREATGRGPEAIRAYVHDDLVVCILRGNLSRSA